MKPWEHPDAADQIPDPTDSPDEVTRTANDVYEQGAKKAMEAIIISIDAGATLSMIRENAVTFIEHIDRTAAERER